MKKTIAFLCCFLITLIFCLPLSASAHPGRTDGNGGHTDKSTGEYHYHHGYPAHDHWDMDGDGDIDCPYLFDDKTNNSGGGASNNSNSVSLDKNNTSKNNSSTIKQEEESTVPAFIYWIIGILAIVIIGMYITIRGKNETIEANEKSFRLRQADEEAKVKEGLNNLHKALKNKYGENYLSAISSAPDGDFIGDDMLPHSSDAKTNPYIDKYVFYFGGHPYGSDVKYHHRNCRFARSDYPINAMYLQERRHYRPCMLCSCGLPDTKWVQEYRNHYEFLKRYIDLEQDDLRKKTMTSTIPVPRFSPSPNEPDIQPNYRSALKDKF